MKSLLSSGNDHAGEIYQWDIFITAQTYCVTDLSFPVSFSAGYMFQLRLQSPLNSIKSQLKVKFDYFLIVVSMPSQHNFPYFHILLHLL